MICTYNRPRELHIVLQMLINQEVLPNSISIVATSNSEISDETKNTIFRLESNGVLVTIISSERGLTLQRNKAIQNLPGNAEIVTFIDDDIILPVEYIKMVNQTFKDNQACVGVGGVTSDNPQKNRSPFLRRLFLLDSNFPGRLLRSGINTTFRFSSIPYEVEWLPGCCMSYRKKIFDHLVFDERRVKVGWGEDVDFSVRAGTYGKLFVFYIPGIVHTQSRLNRATNLERAIHNDYSRLLLALDRLGKVSKLFIYLSILGEFLLSFDLFSFFAKSIKSYLRNFVRNFRLRLQILVVALKKFIKFNRSIRSSSVIHIAIKLIGARLIEGVKRFRAFKESINLVKDLERERCE